MTGRLIFQKYDHIIKILIALHKPMPKKLLESRLNAIRNRSGKIAMLRRYIYLSLLAKNVGKNVSIFPGVFLYHIENLTIHDNVSIHEMCYIDADGEIEIGNNVSIAHRSTILSSTHTYTQNDIPIKYQELIKKKTLIGDNVWIGCGCTIIAGISIGCGSVIGANSTVTHDITDNVICAGSPAIQIRERVN